MIVSGVQQSDSVFDIVQLLSRVQLFETPMDCSTPGFPITISRSWLKLMSIELVMLFNHLILCLPLLLLPSIFPIIRVFSNELALHQEAKALKLRLQHLSSQ